MPEGVAKGGWERHPQSRRLCGVMQRLRAGRVGVRFEGTVFRAVHPKYSRWRDLISGVGSRIGGSRWNPPGLTRVLHAAKFPEDALMEALAERRRLGFSDASGLPLVMRGIQCRLRHVLDLGDGEVRQRLGVSLERLVETNWRRENREGREAITQAVGRACYEAGYEGLLAPSSAAWTKVNVVVFVENLGERSGLEIADGWDDAKLHELLLDFTRRRDDTAAEGA